MYLQMHSKCTTLSASQTQHVIASRASDRWESRYFPRDLKGSKYVCDIKMLYRSSLPDFSHVENQDCVYK